MSTTPKSPSLTMAPNALTARKTVPLADKKARAARAVAPPADISAKYKRTSREQTVLDRYRAERAERSTPRFMVTTDGKNSISNDHAEPAVGHLLLMDALRTTDHDFAGGIIRHLVDIGSQGQEVDVKGMDLAISLIKAVRPRDELETMLAHQWGRTSGDYDVRPAARSCRQHSTARQCVERFQQTCTHLRCADGGMKRHRSKAEQRVCVERVNVRSGGQALVGPSQPEGEGNMETPANPMHKAHAAPAAS